MVLDVENDGLASSNRFTWPRRLLGLPVRNAAEPHECGWGIAVVVSAHFGIALIDGLQRGNGVFFLSWKDEFEASVGETAAVSSVMYAMVAFSGLLGGVLTKRFGCRPTAIFGGALASLSVFIGHLANSITHLCILAGIGGAGLGIFFNAVMTAVSVFFNRHYKTANAVAFSGSGLGTVALPPLFQLLQDAYGWRGAALVISAIMANLVTCGVLLRPPAMHQDNQSEPIDGDASVSQSDGNQDASSENACPTDAKRNCATGANDLLVDDGGRHSSVRVLEAEGTDGRASGGPATASCETRPGAPNRLCAALGLDLFVKSYRFGLLCLLQIEVGLPYFGCVVFLVPHAEGAGVAPSSAAFLLSLYGVGNLLGRLASGPLIGWKLTPEMVSAFSLAVASFSLILINLEGYAPMAAGAFIQGLSAGVYFAIFFVLLRRYAGKESFSTSLGISYIFLGISSVSGPLLTGLLYDATRSYQAVFYVLAGMYAACTLQILLFPLLARLEPGDGHQPVFIQKINCV